MPTYGAAKSGVRNTISQMEACLAEPEPYATCSLRADVLQAAIVLGSALDSGGQAERLIAGAAASAVIGLPALLNPKGMGLGDAKLVAVMGLYLGAAVVPAIFIAFILGTVIGIAIIMRKGMSQGRKTSVPFGPFFALGAIVGILAGNELVSAYLGTF